MKLISVINHTVTQPGKVVRVRYLSGTTRLYEVGIEFDSPINVALFHHGTTPTRILLLCDELMSQMLKGLLSKENVHIAMAEDRESLTDSLRSQAADLAVTDRPVDEMVELAQALRSEAIPTPLLALLPGADDEVRSSLQEAGFDAVVNLPPTRDELRTAIAAHQCEPLTSSLILDTDMLDVIDAFVLRMPEYIEAVRNALKDGQIEPIRESLRGLRIGASCAGFEALGTVIQEALATFESEPDMALVGRKITQILRICSRVTGASCQPS